MSLKTNRTTNRGRLAPIIIACIGGLLLIAGVVTLIIMLTNTDPVVAKYSLSSIVTNGKDSPQKAALYKAMGANSEIVFHRNGTGKMIVPTIDTVTDEEIEEARRRREETQINEDLAPEDEPEDHPEEDATTDETAKEESGGGGVPMTTYDFTWKDGEMIAITSNGKLKSYYSLDSNNNVTVDSFQKINENGELEPLHGDSIQYKFRRDK